MKTFFRALYSLLLFGAGILHFIHERKFRKAVPAILPFRKAIVLITGTMELIFAILLWVKKVRNITGKLLACFMVLVFPANVYMAVKKISFQADKQTSPWILWLRLPLQLPLIFGALALGNKVEQ